MNTDVLRCQGTFACGCGSCSLAEFVAVNVVAAAAAGGTAEPWTLTASGNLTQPTVQSDLLLIKTIGEWETFFFRKKWDTFLCYKLKETRFIQSRC